MTREIERLLNDRDNTYAHTLTSLEKKLDAKADLMMRKLDEILKCRNQETRCGSTEDSCQATDGPEATVTRRLHRDQERVLSLTIRRDLGQPR